MGFKLPNGSDLSEEQLDIINLPTTKDWVIKVRQVLEKQLWQYIEQVRRVKLQRERKY